MYKDRTRKAVLGESLKPVPYGVIWVGLVLDCLENDFGLSSSMK